MSSLYDRDFNLWIQKTVSNLNSKDMDAVDWEILIDEIEGMGKSDYAPRSLRIAALYIKILASDPAPHVGARECASLGCRARSL